MTDRPEFTQEIIIPNREVLAFGNFAVGMAMTGAAYDNAKRNKAVRIEADIDAMQRIMSEIGIEPQHRPRIAQVLGVREGMHRDWINSWDMFLPDHQDSPLTGRWYLAGTIDQQPIDRAPTVSWEQIRDVARFMGADYLNEMIVQGWDEESRRTHAAAYATALIFGRKPLDLPSRWASYGVGWGKTALGIFGSEHKRQSAVRRIKELGNRIPEPFVVRYSPAPPPTMPYTIISE